jgi:hypothetical protein
MADTSYDGSSNSHPQAISGIALIPEPGPNESAGTEIDPLGAHAREAAALISKLTQIGLDRLNIPLPKCVVLGMNVLSRKFNVRLT